MIKRCILIFPEFENGKLIDDIRAKYDPVAHNVRPHVTLVFPFESDIDTVTLRRHVADALRDVAPFKLSLQGIVEQRGFGNYLLLDVHRGKRRIVELHSRLYTGMLEPFLPEWSRAFVPHMTVGYLEDATEFEAAADATRHFCEEFSSVIRRVSCEIIAENSDSIIEFEVELDAGE